MLLALKKLCGPIIFSAVALTVFLYYIYQDSHISSTPSFPIGIPSSSSSPATADSADVVINSFAKYFINYPLNGPDYGDQFGEFGQRIQILRDWISMSETAASKRTNALCNIIERVIFTMAPFLRNPATPGDPTPFKSLRNTFISGSQGIVIPTGLSTFRFACHLVVALREVHHSTLPIQIFYAGDADLPLKNRQIIASLAEDIELVDILHVFDDTTLKLADSGWALKSFAALASKYEQILLLDADAVFVQPPEVVFAQRDYKESGALFYHDRLLWQHGFQDRHNWWKKQMEHQEPSPALLKSLVWMEDYAEEQDSGLVALDKGRLSVLTGLLHVCWQNTYAVREQITYKITYGDKESYWFGFELSGTPFAFEKHYGSMLGSLHKGDDKMKDKVCSFTIAHTDENDKLLWYNGSLLKNKAVDTRTFDVPTHWMMDATWEKGGSKPEISCMVGGEVRTLTVEETKIIEMTVEAAKRVDSAHSLVV
jgi:alpha 1,3-mannosyltransferase